MATLLIVEDTAANMKLAEMLLTRVGHTVLCAVDAEAALLVAVSERPDLILMDIQLPGMDGFAATKLLKGDPTTAAIPIIALTALATNADRERSELAGCDGYLAKPLRHDELYSKIDELLKPELPCSNGDTPL